jgi:cation diffusion facilitator CzcD-associated flavoprotein CzcO
MPDRYPVYPSRDQMREYQESFARHHGLYDAITFTTAVISVEPIGERGAGGWTVETSDGARTHYDGVLVANGHLWHPRMPSYPGTFTSRSLH